MAVLQLFLKYFAVVVHVLFAAINITVTYVVSWHGYTLICYNLPNGL